MVQVSTHVLSPKAMSIADYLLHKAPYWSSSQYDHRVSENSRNTFLTFVEDQHKDSRKNADFEGDSALLKCDKATCHDEHYVRCHAQAAGSTWCLPATRLRRRARARAPLRRRARAPRASCPRFSVRPRLSMQTKTYLRTVLQPPLQRLQDQGIVQTLSPLRRVRQA